MDLNDINIDLTNDKKIESVDNIKIEEEKKNTDENITFKVQDSAFELSLRIDDFPSTKDMDKFIKNIERIVRTSSEYKVWTKYIVDALGDNVCCLTKESTHECHVEIHHHPISLFMLCESVLRQYMNHNKKFCTFDIAKDVIELHFKNKVGYIPLLSNLHEKYHSGFLSLPIEFVKGDYKYILDTYPLLDEDIDKVLQLCSVKKEQLKIEWSKNNYPGVIENNSPQIEIDQQKQIEKTG